MINNPRRCSIFERLLNTLGKDEQNNELTQGISKRRTSLEQDLKTLTVKQLKELACKMSIPVYGNKEEIIRCLHIARNLRGMRDKCQRFDYEAAAAYVKQYRRNDDKK